MSGRSSWRLRALGLALTVATVIGLSLGSTGWTQVARAQTVPTLTFTPAPPARATPRPTAILPSATPVSPPATDMATGRPASQTAVPVGVMPSATWSPTANTPSPAPPPVTVAADLAACGPGPYAGQTPAGDPLAPLALGTGSVQLLALDAMLLQSGAAMIVARLAAATIPVAELPQPPAGWRPLSCGLNVTALGDAGQAADFLPRGLTLCLDLPARAGLATLPRLSYFDPRPGFDRWVFLPGMAAAGQICLARFRQPATFALLMPAP